MYYKTVFAVYLLARVVRCLNNGKVRFDVCTKIIIH